MHAERARLRRAYEWGRLRASLPRALVTAAPVAVLAIVIGGAPALVWLPLTVTAWLFAHWRGDPLLRGAYLGFVAGIVTLALPLTILRPCCSPESMAAGMDCCTNPSACWTAGGLLGLALAPFLPNDARRWSTAAGMVIGVASVAVLRCTALFAAEALGLLGGIVAGVLAATLARGSLALRSSSR
ncbi:MAG: hypothetical protein KIT84_15785 [Labilithrix sp.]|nr:hypothetical protein [Labilithrix sp.]MCW5812488.1 hypothetical protein [Labilithrix sp.]